MGVWIVRRRPDVRRDRRHDGRRPPLRPDGAGRAIIAQRNSGDVTRGYVASVAPEDWAAQAGFADDAGLRAYLAEQYAGWAPELRRFVTESDAYVERAFRVLPLR